MTARTCRRRKGEQVKQEIEGRCYTPVTAELVADTEQRDKKHLSLGRTTACMGAPVSAIVDGYANVLPVVRVRTGLVHVRRTGKIVFASGIAAERRLLETRLG